MIDDWSFNNNKKTTFHRHFYSFERKLYKAANRTSRVNRVMNLLLSLTKLHFDSSGHKGSISIYFRFCFFLYQSTDLDELYKQVTSDFLISEHWGCFLNIDLSAYRTTFPVHKSAIINLRRALRFYVIRDITFVPTSMSLGRYKK